MAVALALLACGQTDTARDKSVDMAALPASDPEAQFVVPEELISELQSSALNGDGRAAFRLFHHFSIQKNIAESEFWLKIAVENQDPFAIQQYATRLWNEGGARNCARAKYLYERAWSLDPATKAPGMDERRSIEDAMQNCIDRGSARPPESSASGVTKADAI